MAPKSTPTTKANYKSYEAQARMIRAMVAAHPDVKWNYKEIAACIGSDISEHAVNHRFRPIRAQAAIIREARAQGLDIKDLLSQDELPATQEAIDKQNIAKYFGQSTGDGIQFQFRGIKRDAELLRQTEAEGGDVAACLTSGSPGSAMTTTPSRATPSRRGGKAGGRARERAGGVRKRGRATIIKRASSDDDDDDVDDDDDEDDENDDGDEEASLNWDARDVTPSAKRPKTTPAQKSVVPRRAAQRASATIADAVAQLRDSPSPSPSPKVEVTDADPIHVRSIFGPHNGRFTPDMNDEYGDGEI
ncbi:hypothetical protein L249_4865 [Ophiocordyceps polyrhachis-furcata BCC 54312]|uniref:Uncharacterized protein n=1 Tax=Ophiocordyceps polyrhachis-furcata BCC 54312 TaxID=1330021 RepID=A0A367L2I6_9HYPO|nr:hypothetical protein L249_4865 [Ophiocordyceps polyrhachis-furcata BCC 54312]